MSRGYWVYIITNKTNSTLYIGVTDNLKRRIYEHKNKIILGFSQRYNLGKLIYLEEYTQIKEAIAREKQLKNWHRDWKFNLIKSENPDLEEIVILK